MSTDPLTASFPHYTPYQFAGNKPILALDLDGLEEMVYTLRLEKLDDGTPKLELLESKEASFSHQLHHFWSDKITIIVHYKDEVYRYSNAQTNVWTHKLEDFGVFLQDPDAESNRWEYSREFSKNFKKNLLSSAGMGMAFAASGFGERFGALRMNRSRSNKATVETKVQTQNKITTGEAKTPTISSSKSLVKPDVTMSGSKFLERGSVQKALAKAKGVYVFTMKDGTQRIAKYLGQGQGKDGIAGRVKTSWREVSKGRNGKPAKAPGAELEKVEFYKFNPKVDKNVNAQETRMIEEMGGLGPDSPLINTNSAPSTEGNN